MRRLQLTENEFLHKLENPTFKINMVVSDSPAIDGADVGDTQVGNEKQKGYIAEIQFRKL